MTSDFLYRFVQNMDKGELRHCRQTLSSDKAAMEHGYLAMFDALTAMKTFDASHLNDAVKDYPASRHLAVAKVRLYQLVLTNLKQLHSARKNANDPWLRYEEAQILMDMNMLDEAIEVLQKGLEQAVNREDLFMEVPLRDQLRLALKRKGGKDNVNLRTENEYLLVQAAEKLATFTRYSQLADRMFDYVRKYRVSDSEGVKRGVA